MNAYVWSRQLILTATLLACLSLLSNKTYAAAAFAFGQGPDGRWAAQGVIAPDQQTADSAALSDCQRDPTSGYACKVIARISNACFAIAITNDGNGYGWSRNADRGEAVKTAASRCGAMDACTVKQSFCDGTASKSEDDGAFWKEAQRSQPCANVWRLCDSTRGDRFLKACLLNAKAQTTVCYAYHSRDKQVFLDAVVKDKEAQNEFSSALDESADNDAQSRPRSSDNATSADSSDDSGWTCFPSYPQCIRFCMQETGAEGDAGWCGGVCSEHGYSVGKPPGSHRCYHARP
jgi:hypothetical protein